MAARRGSRDRLILCAGAFAAAAAFAAGAAAQGPSGPSAPERFAMRVVAQGLDAPWEITWGPTASSG